MSMHKAVLFIGEIVIKSILYTNDWFSSYPFALFGACLEPGDSYPGN